MIIMSINVLALILAFTGFVVYDAMIFRDQARRDLSVLADMIGHNCAAALLFEDRADITGVLAALKADDSIEGAWVFAATGRALAGYSRSGTGKLTPPPLPRSDGCWFHEGGLFCFRPIFMEGASVGTVLVHSNLRSTRVVLNKHLGIIGAVLLISFVCVLLVSSRLQGLISGPLIRLADLARTVSRDKDYSVRGIKEGNDESGQLVEAFNDMLEQIAQQNKSLTIARQEAELSAQKATRSADEMKNINLELEEEVRTRRKAQAELKTYQHELENMVQARTAQLTLANEQLSHEIAERREAEARIRAALKEKSILLGEIHHRVRNNLQTVSSLLNLSRRRTLSPEACQVLESARSRILTMSLIHSQLYRSKNFNRVDMARHIYKLWASIHQVYEYMKDGMVPVINCRGVNLTVTQAIPCALVLNEAITNVFKHAYEDGKAGPCHITMKQSPDNRIVMRIRDEGRGIPETVDIKRSETLGFKLMRNLVQHQLGGTFRVEYNNGTDILIEFVLLPDAPGHPASGEDEGPVEHRREKP